MKESTKESLNSKLEEIIKEFNKTLSEKGFENVEIQNFNLQEEARACLEYKWVRKSNGTYYIKCMRWA